MRFQCPKRAYGTYCLINLLFEKCFSRNVVSCFDIFAKSTETEWKKLLYQVTKISKLGMRNTQKK